jgi:hypothetical protein
MDNRCFSSKIFHPNNFFSPLHKKHMFRPDLPRPICLSGTFPPHFDNSQPQFFRCPYNLLTITKLSLLHSQQTIMTKLGTVNWVWYHAASSNHCNLTSYSFYVNATSADPSSSNNKYSHVEFSVSICIVIFVDGQWMKMCSWHHGGASKFN